MMTVHPPFELHDDGLQPGHQVLVALPTFCDIRFNQLKFFNILKNCKQRGVFDWFKES